jgi:hypothetical protein
MINLFSKEVNINKKNITSVRAHIIEIEPILFKTVTKVARAKSAFVACSRFSDKFI